MHYLEYYQIVSTDWPPRILNTSISHLLLYWLVILLFTAESSYSESAQLHMCQLKMKKITLKILK